MNLFYSSISDVLGCNLEQHPNTVLHCKAKQPNLSPPSRSTLLFPALDDRKVHHEQKQKNVATLLRPRALVHIHGDRLFKSGPIANWFWQLPIVSLIMLSRPFSNVISRENPPDGTRDNVRTPIGCALCISSLALTAAFTAMRRHRHHEPQRHAYTFGSQRTVAKKRPLNDQHLRAR